MWFEAFSAAARRIAAVAALLIIPALPALADPIALSSLMGSPAEGTWRTLNGTEITVAPCGTDFCGALSWVIVPPEYAVQCEQDKAAFGPQMLDYQNPKKSLRSRPILGLNMLTMHPTNDPTVFTANIYSPQDGKSYDGIVWILNGNTTMRFGGGCVGSMCVATQDWPKVPTREVSPDFTCRPE